LHIRSRVAPRKALGFRFVPRDTIGCVSETAMRTADGKRLAPGVLLPNMTVARFYVLLSALMLGSLLSAMDTAIVNTSLPTIAGELQGFSNYAWVGTSYLLCSAVTMPIAGKLSDLYGRTRVFNIVLVWFIVASVLCGAAQTMGQLIAARGLQGIGGGAIQAVTFAILGDVVAPRERGRYIAIYVAASTIASIGGPLLGGVIVDNAPWQWVFLINVPIGLIALIGSIKVVRVPFAPKGGKLDVLGAVLLAGCVTGFLVALENSERGWLRAPVMIPLLIGCVLLPVFLMQERRAPEPMIPLSLFRNRIVASTYLMGGLIGAVAFGSGNVFLPAYFQNANGVSSARSGLYIAPTMFGAFFGTLLAGRIMARYGRYKLLPIIGCGTALIASALMLRISPDVPYWQLGVPIFLSGLGAGAIFTVTSVAMQNAIDRSVMGVATATSTFFRSFGGSLGIALFGTFFGDRVDRTVRGRVATDASVSDLIRDPEQIRGLPADVRAAVVEGLGSGVRVVYIAVLVVLVLLLAVCLQIEDRPLAAAPSPITDTPVADASHCTSL
jgi:EmrB/QacA subfamily drug resistance transporter